MVTVTTRGKERTIAMPRAASFAEFHGIGNKKANVDLCLMEAAFNAISKGNCDELARILALGTNPNSRDNDGWTLLMEATVMRNCDMVKILLSRGADFDLVSRSGLDVFRIAELNGYVDITRELKRIEDERYAHIFPILY